MFVIKARTIGDNFAQGWHAVNNFCILPREITLEPEESFKRGMEQSIEYFKSKGVEIVHVTPHFQIDY